VLYFEQTIHPVTTDPDLPAMYYLVPGDGSRAYLLGELWEVRQVLDILQALVDQGTHDGPLDEDDERVSTWLTVKEAAQQSNVSIRAVQWACKNGRIEGAKPNPWRFSLRAFRRWRHSEPVKRRGHKG
jgi:hypothetical protein